MELSVVAGIADLVARSLALAGVAVAGVIVVTHWAVRRRRLAPFGWWSRSIRKLSDPALRPIERRLLRGGGNPQDATYWLFGIAILAGLLLISGVRWLFGLGFELLALAGAGPGTWFRVALDWTVSVLTAALFIRVIAGWLGVSTYRPWMRPVYWLTEWLLGPIRRLLPRTGMIDFSPLIAYFALVIVRLLVASAFGP
jgi:YggT family protein